MMGCEELAAPVQQLPLSGEEHALWQRWRENRDQAAREALILQHLEFARIIAAKAYRGRFTDEFDFKEYMQFATLGLIEAVDRFDPAFNASFRTYASQRIRGAILDGIERMSEQLQQIAMRKRVISARADSLQGGLTADAKEDDLFACLAEVAIGLALGYMLEGTTMYQAQEPVLQDNAYRRLEVQQLQQQVVALVDALPAKEKMVVKSHYFNQLPFETIATMLGVTKGRVSQIHRQALDRLMQSLRLVRPCDLAG